MSLLQNSVSFVPSSWKKRLTAIFSIKSRELSQKLKFWGSLKLLKFFKAEKTLPLYLVFAPIGGVCPDSGSYSIELVKNLSF
jgi:hypothetical protein